MHINSWHVHVYQVIKIIIFKIKNERVWIRIPCLIQLLLMWLCCYKVVHTQDPGNTQTPTAFTKGQTANLHLTKGEKIPFNKRITEFGANFDADGSFVCQTPGLYAFTFYGLTEQNWELWLEMMKNDQLIASGELSRRCETIYNLTVVLSFNLWLWLSCIYFSLCIHLCWLRWCRKCRHFAFECRWQSLLEGPRRLRPDFIWTGRPDLHYFHWGTFVCG